VLSAQPAVDRVWPGFWPDDQAFLVYEPEGDALLYSPVAPPAGYAPYQSAASGAVDAWRERLYWHEGVPDGLYGIYDTAYGVGETTATAVILQPTLVATLQTLFHETFHVYQGRHFEGESGGFGYIAPESITASIMAKAEVERLILRAALQAEDRASLRKLVGQYLAVRASRTAEMPQKARDIERSVERSEGSAQLVGIQAAAAALADEPEAISVEIGKWLAIPVDDLGGGLAEQMFRWRLYGTGAAIGLLLDRTGCDDWREKLEHGASFEALLAEAIDFDAAAVSGSVAERALLRFDYISLLRQARSREVADPGPSFEAPARVVVTFAGPPGNIRSSFSGTFSALQEELVMIDADLYTAEGADFELVARHVDVLLDSRDELQLSFAVAALPVIDNLYGDNSTATLQKLNMESGTLTIRADRPVEVTTTPASLLIRVLDRE
jgi:hypothetical protein